MNAPPLRAYVVTLNFGEGGPLHTNIWLAPDAASAAAEVTVHLMQQFDIKAPLRSSLCAELEPARLRHWLRAVEGKLPESGNAEVLSLVPRELDPRQPIGGGPPLDAADASTFTGSNVNRLWEQKLRRQSFQQVADMPQMKGHYWQHRDGLGGGALYVYDEEYGPPIPPGAA